MSTLKLVFLSVLFVFVISCKVEKAKNIITLIDTSGTIDSITINWYRETTKSCILQKMGMNDRLMVLPIDFGSQTAGQEIYKVDFSKNNYRNEFAGFQSDEVEAQSHADSIELEISVFQTAFATATKEREKYNRGTDIIGSLKEASKYFDDDAENIIVILSDMMQYTDKTKMNMESQLNTQAEVDSYLSKIEPINLQGFKILVLTGLDYKIKPDKYNAIRMFWEVYFQRCSGNLVEYSSGMQTKLEESILEK